MKISGKDLTVQSHSAKIEINILQGASQAQTSERLLSKTEFQTANMIDSVSNQIVATDIQM